jgi:urease gamma subunit
MEKEHLTPLSAIQALMTGEWERLLEVLTLEHIFAPEELAEMTPQERRLLQAYLKTKRMSDWLSLPTGHNKNPRRRKAIVGALQSERIALWTHKIDQFLKMCVHETLRRYYYAALIKIAQNLSEDPRSLRRVEVEALKALQAILSEYDQSVMEWVQRLLEAREMEKTFADAEKNEGGEPPSWHSFPA